MRILRFIVDGQSITQDPTCDFSGLIPGSKGYLRAEFSFSSDWNNCAKVAAFYSPMGREYPPQILKDGKSCVIPAEALEKQVFKIKVLGKRGDGFEIPTNKLTVCQDGGKQ